MDGKYAKYIPSEHGFITKLEIKDNELYVYTKKTSKGEPHKYPLGEKFAKYSERLENQYRLITEEENLQLIKSDLIKDTKSMLDKIFLILSLPTILASVISSFVLSAVAPLLVVPIVETILLTAYKLILIKESKDFDEEMDTIKTYLEERQHIEEMSKIDSNIIGNLKSTTINRIDINHELQRDALIPDVFDITLLDDLIGQQKSKKELKKLLTNYKICLALEQPQVFVNPTIESDNSYEQEETQQPRTGKYIRTRKPENK